MTGPLTVTRTMTPEEEAAWERQMKGIEGTCCPPLEDVPFPMAAWRPGFPRLYVGLAFHWRRLCPRCASEL